MIFPTVNLNGTSKRTLYADYYHALQKVQEAIVALRAIEVHGRDYPVYPSKPGLGAVLARREHAQRIANLMHVEEDLTFIIEAILAQKPDESVS